LRDAKKTHDPEGIKGHRWGEQPLNQEPKGAKWEKGDLKGGTLKKRQEKKEADKTRHEDQKRGINSPKETDTAKKTNESEDHKTGKAGLEQRGYPLDKQKNATSETPSRQKRHVPVFKEEQEKKKRHKKTTGVAR